ncbi:hypothetical protein BC828DRAFT_405829 [Blastocladiella britannica]|nr:hypothetical protein BC828DRAFT_405829 [Blastocladiella britannica]
MSRYSAILLVALLAALASAQTAPATPAFRLPTFAAQPVPTNAPMAKACSADNMLCVTVADIGKWIDVTAVGPAAAKWIGVGFGTGMIGADIYVGYVLPNSTFFVSNRRATAHAPPAVVPLQNGVPIKGGKAVLPGYWVSHFQRPKANGDGNLTVVDTTKPISMIFAFHDSVPVNFTVNAALPNSEFRGALVQHTMRGKLTVDLNDKAQQAAAAAGPAPGGAASSPTSTSASATPAASESTAAKPNAAGVSAEGAAMAGLSAVAMAFAALA